MGLRDQGPRMATKQKYSLLPKKKTVFHKNPPIVYCIMMIFLHFYFEEIRFLSLYQNHASTRLESDISGTTRTEKGDVQSNYETPPNDRRPQNRHKDWNPLPETSK
jgi:hypothetical protein